MKKVLIVLAALSLAGALLVPATSFAHRGEPHNAAKAMAEAMKHPLVVRGGKAARLKIVHVQRGCHVWSNGPKTARGVRVFLQRGARLTVRNEDIDMQKLVRLPGAHAALGGFIQVDHQSTVTFAKAGVYRLRTRTKEMPGMPDVKTTGPDNPLPMVVVVK